MAPLLSERKLPLLIQCFLIILLVRNSITVERYTELHFFLLGALFSTLIALLLLFVKTKASLHMMGISALTLFIFGLTLHYQTQNIALIVFLILTNGFVASSRLVMKAHTSVELIIGILLGSIPQILLLFIWL
jgi:membrane-associated phospholipid phosphatase